MKKTILNFLILTLIIASFIACNESNDELVIDNDNTQQKNTIVEDGNPIKDSSYFLLDECDVYFRVTVFYPYITSFNHLIEIRNRRLPYGWGVLSTTFEDPEPVSVNNPIQNQRQEVTEVWIMLYLSRNSNPNFPDLSSYPCIPIDPDVHVVSPNARDRLITDLEGDDEIDYAE